MNMENRTKQIERIIAAKLQLIYPAIKYVGIKQKKNWEIGQKGYFDREK